MRWLYKKIYGVPPPEPPTTEYDWTNFGPWQKWKYFARFPWKIILHIILTLIALLSALERTSTVSSVNFNSLQTFNHFFLGDQSQWIDGQYTLYFYTVQEVNATINNIVQQYYSLATNSLDMMDTSGGSWDFAGLSHLPTPTLSITRMAGDLDLAAVFSEKAPSSTVTEVYPLTLSHPCGPLNTSDIVYLKKHIFGPLLSMTINLQFYIANIVQKVRAKCIYWNVNIGFDFSTRGGRIVARLAADSKICDPYALDIEQIFQLHTPYPLLALMAAVFGFPNLILTAKAFWSSIRLGMRAAKREAILNRQRPSRKRANKRKDINNNNNNNVNISSGNNNSGSLEDVMEDDEDASVSGGGGVKKPPAVGFRIGPATGPDEDASVETWGEGSVRSYASDALSIRGTPSPSPAPGESSKSAYLKAVFKFVRFRDIVSPVATILLLSYSLTTAFSSTIFVSDNASLSFILGIAIFLFFLEFIFYLRYFPRQYLLNLSIRRALPQVVRMLLGILPVYFAYCLAAMMWFGSYTQRFSSFVSTSIGLFGVMNGDDVINSFNMTYSYNPLWGFLSQIFFYSYMVFFTYTVLSILVTILQESYIRVTEELMTDETRQKVQRERVEQAVGAFLNVASGGGGGGGADGDPTKLGEQPKVAIKAWVQQAKKKAEARSSSQLTEPLISAADNETDDLDAAGTHPPSE